MNVLKPIIYFSVFNHPLTKEEIFRFSDITDIEKAENQLNNYAETGVIKKIDNYILVQNNTSQITKRENGNKAAENVMPQVKQTAKFIASFPFIQGVAISGSLSKGYFDEKSDFDFFVITKAKRVWITRMFLAFYKRFFLNNSYKEFCINYFVSTQSLEIEEKNRFTATEIATVIPVFGKTAFNQFYKSNMWVNDYFPNINLFEPVEQIIETKKSNKTRSIEFLFDNFIGTFLNYISMRFITKKWKHRYKKHNNNPYKSKKGISKHHPENYQDRVLRKINEQYQIFEEEHGIKISRETA